MGSGLFPELDENALYFSRADEQEILGTFASYPFYLDDADWPTVEHYFQAMKFEDERYREKIRTASGPKQARKLGRSRLKKVRSDWKKIRTVVMTRAVYTKCRTWPLAGQALLDTADKRLVENSQYDYFWGCGRDRRGENNYGKVLTAVREKLTEEARDSAAE